MEMDAFKDTVKIKAFHDDNGVFKEQLFRQNLDKTGQYISFCGVGLIGHHK